jgi:hypothetical protein
VRGSRGEWADASQDQPAAFLDQDSAHPLARVSESHFISHTLGQDQRILVTPTANPSIYPSIYLSFHPSIQLSIHTSLYLYVTQNKPCQVQAYCGETFPSASTVRFGSNQRSSESSSSEVLKSPRVNFSKKDTRTELRMASTESSSYGIRPPLRTCVRDKEFKCAARLLSTCTSLKYKAICLEPSKKGIACAPYVSAAVVLRNSSCAQAYKETRWKDGR